MKGGSLRFRRDDVHIPRCPSSRRSSNVKCHTEREYLRLMIRHPSKHLWIARGAVSGEKVGCRSTYEEFLAPLRATSETCFPPIIRLRLYLQSFERVMSMKVTKGRDAVFLGPEIPLTPRYVLIRRDFNAESEKGGRWRLRWRKVGQTAVLLVVLR
jgi:hypothetical protein